MKKRVLINRDVKIGKNKVAGLNISVNAIVVFVLAFAMLGVGITFINMIREEMIGGLGDIVPEEELENPATAQTPLTIDSEITVGQNDEERIDVGFYNTLASTQEDVDLEIVECVAGGGDTEDMDDADLPEIHSPSATVEGGESTAFSAVIEPEDGPPLGTYLCTIELQDDGGDTLESESFYFELAP